VIRFKGGGIKPCKASIPANYLARYQAMRDDGSSKTDSKKRGVEVVDHIVMMQQNSSVATLLAGKRRCGSLSSNSSKPHLKMSHPVSSSASSKNFFGTSIQPSISADIHHQTDIRQVNNTIAQMAIVDFFHCENISDLVVETPRFKRMVNVLSKIGSDFEIPKRKQIGIGGPLLDLNFQTKYNDNKTNLRKGADVFGMSFLGDGATVKRMPLVKILAACADTPSITVSIQDCTKHLQ